MASIAFNRKKISQLYEEVERLQKLFKKSDTPDELKIIQIEGELNRRRIALQEEAESVSNYRIPGHEFVESLLSSPIRLTKLK